MSITQAVMLQFDLTEEDVAPGEDSYSQFFRWQAAALIEWLLHSRKPPTIMMSACMSPHSRPFTLKQPAGSAAKLS